MKFYYLILFYLFVCCNSNTNNLIKEKIIEKNNFTNILKEIQLVEAKFESDKINDIENANAQLIDNYIRIYTKYQITELEFKNSLNYYMQKPELLNSIYIKAINDLNEEKTTLNHP